MPKPVLATSELLSQQASQLEALLRELLLDHSTLVELPDLSSATVLVAGFPSHKWDALDAEGRGVQARFLELHRRFSELVLALLARAPADVRREVEEARDNVIEIVEQTKGTFSGDLQRFLSQGTMAITAQLDAVRQLHDPTPGEPVYVPDANAVVWNPALDNWAFDGMPRFWLVLTSTCLRELDELKQPYRNESLRRKAESAIRRIKEYANRGDIHSGVVLRKDRTTLRMTATEPDFEKTMPWLDPTVDDDRLIASALEVVREHPHSPVLIVTRDVGVQNKARYAGISFVEPPDPPERQDEKPRKRGLDVRILDLRPVGGSSREVSFAAEIQNRDQRPSRVKLVASVGGTVVQCSPETLDLLVNQPPTPVRISVLRPQFAELVPALNNATTLYGEELVVEVHDEDDEPLAEERWKEPEYDPETDRARYEAQQRAWRFARGEATPADLRADAIDRMHAAQAGRFASDADDDEF